MTKIWADTILSGGKVVTMDAAGTVAEAIAISGSRIRTVGSADEIAALRGPATVVTPLEGRIVVPGIIDTHAHMEREGLKTLRPSLASARCIGDILAIVTATAQTKAPGDWVVTMPVGQPPFYFGGPGTLAEGRMPNRFELDRAAPDHPVCIAGVFCNWGEPPGYTAMNSRALSLLGIDRNTPPAGPGVEIEHDPASGEPTGIIVERNNRPTIDFSLLGGITGFDFAERMTGLRRSMAAYNAVGTTSVYEGHGSAPETIAVYRQLWQQRELTVRARLCVSPPWENVQEGARAMRDWLAYGRGRGLGDEWLRVGGIFIGFAGSEQVACACRAALPNTGWTGFIEWSHSLDEFRQYARLAAEYDLRLNTIVGDHLDAILGVLEEIDSHLPLSGRRWVIEHPRRITPIQIKRIGRLGLHVTTIPVYTIWKNGGALTRAMSVEEIDDYVPHAALLGAGVRASAGTDNIPYNPFFTIQTLVTREERKSGGKIAARQAVTRLQALRLMTADAAYITFEEDCKGTLDAGKFADLAVLSGDFFGVQDSALGEITSALTMVGGVIVHRSPAL